MSSRTVRAAILCFHSALLPDEVFTPFRPRSEETSMVPIRGLRAVVETPMQSARRRARPGKRERARMKIARSEPEDTKNRRPPVSDWRRE